MNHHMKNEPPVEWDSEVRELGKRKFVNAEHWLIRYRLNGRTISHKIASTEHLSVTHARQIARQMKLMSQHGVDPRPWMKDRVRELLGIEGEPQRRVTLSQLFERYFKDHAWPHCKTAGEMERTYRLHLAHWANRDCSSLTRLEVQDLVTQLGKNAGTYAANRVVQLLGAAYNKGLLWELIECKSPTKGVTEFREVSRDRFFSQEEIALLFEEILKLRYSGTRDCLLLLMLTGQRRANVFAMEWSEIDFESALWNIPAEKMKAGRSHHVPLIPDVVSILKTRHGERESKRWVFPSDVSRTGHLIDITNAWGRILKRTGIQNARLHDHRRTLAAWEMLTGSDIAIVGKMLGHSDLRSTQIYARLNLDPVRASMIRATDAMFRKQPPPISRYQRKLGAIKGGVI
ncbi:MAG: site-specific integrase [Cyanobacteria bacterium SZAS-4]|nr:site-specific integrase [Cyanobacteria bacterium SZAS-4]